MKKLLIGLLVFGSYSTFAQCPKKIFTNIELNSESLSVLNEKGYSLSDNIRNSEIILKIDTNSSVKKPLVRKIFREWPVDSVGKVDFDVALIASNGNQLSLKSLSRKFKPDCGMQQCGVEDFLNWENDIIVDNLATVLERTVPSCSNL